MSSYDTMVEKNKKSTFTKISFQTVSQTRVGKDPVLTSKFSSASKVSSAQGGYQTPGKTDVFKIDRFLNDPSKAQLMKLPNMDLEQVSA